MGHDAAEPTIGIDHQGHIFYTAADFQLDNNDVLTSSVGGRRWSVVTPRVGPARAHPITRDPYIYVDEATGRVFNIDLTLACSFMSFSDNRGESWTTNPLACGMPVNDHQTLFAGPAVRSETVGYPNIVYYCFNNVLSSYCTKSLDGGISFSAAGLPAFTGFDPSLPGEVCGGLSGHGRVGPDGTVYLPRGWCGRPYLAISHDEGLTWDRVQIAGNGSADVHNSVAVDRKGNLYYLWVARDLLPYLSVSTNGGKSWSKPVMVAPRGVREAVLPAIDAHEPGRIALLYMGTEDVSGPVKNRDYTYATWNGYITYTTSALQNRPVFQTARTNPGGDPLFRGNCKPPCGAIFDFLDIEISPHGDVYGAFVDACTKRCATTGPPNVGADGLITHLTGIPKL